MTKTELATLVSHCKHRRRPGKRSQIDVAWFVSSREFAVGAAGLLTPKTLLPR